MKNIFSKSIAIFAAILMVSCNDVMDDKSVIDASFLQLPAPEITAVAEALDYQSVKATVTVSDSTFVQEVGILFVDGKDSSYVASKNVLTVSEVTVEKLEELTTYAVIPYVMTKSGKIVFGKSVNVTTPKKPVITPDGTYVVTEYEYDSDEGKFIASEETYEMTIAFAEGSDTKMLITGFWGYNETVEGVYDPETASITIASGQVIGEHSKYGTVTINGVNSAESFVLTADGFNYVSSAWNALVSAGSFGTFKVEMKRKQ